MNETEVIIVGAGPTGLMMAALLARRGLKVRVLDGNEQQAHETRVRKSER
jgi:2-polyprenyl-6-methoxyphenol hydroxylase-like FAD-dependent oxidoreductase